MKTLTTLSLMIAAALSVAGMRFHPRPQAHTSPGGNFVFTMVPGGKGAERTEAFGICYQVQKDGGFKEIWRTKGWYSEDIELEFDGQLLARVGSWASGDQDEGEFEDSLAVAFYNKGKLTKSYKIGELVKNMDKVTATEAGYQWLEYRLYESPSFVPGEKVFQLITCDGIRYRFDPATGEILSPKEN